MYNIFKFLVIILIINLLNIKNNNTSIAEDFYIVDNIIIEMVSDNIGSARDQATIEAIMIGFNRLLSWKLNERDFKIIEEVLNNSDSEYKKVREYIGGYKIHHEKFSNINYRAEFSIYYDLTKIKNWLSKNNISYYEKYITNILIIPIMSIDGSIFLWDGPSLWSELWQSKTTNKYRDNFIFPFGDIDDVSTLSYENLYNQNLEKIYNFLDRYNLNNAFIPFLHIKSDNIKKFKAEFGSLLIINRKVEDLITKQTISSLEDEALEDFIVRCKNIISNKFIYYLENHQIVNNITLEFNAHYVSFEDWLNLQKTLKNIKEVIEFNVLSLSINKAVVKIKIAINNESDLFNIFNNSRLGLNKNIYNEYDISIISEDEIYNNSLKNNNFDDGQTILVIE